MSKSFVVMLWLATAAAATTTAAAAAFSPVVRNNETVSAECSSGAPISCKLIEGRSAAAMAWARFDDAIEATGAASLWVSTAPGVPAATAAFAAGFVEGAATAGRIAQQYSNFVASQRVATPSANLTAFLDANDAWLRERIDAAPPADAAYWGAIAWQLRQLEGMAAGYNTAAVAAGDIDILRPLSLRQLQILNLQGDLGDILAAVDPAARRPHPARMSPSELRQYTLASTHCSALVKLLPDNAELYVGHNMWWGYYTMLAVVKRYAFPGQERGWAAESVLMPSYPGLLASSDDFYMLGGAKSHMVALETTNPNFNASSFDLVTPRAVLYWQRAMAANYLARGGEEWMAFMGRHNSGTYNNMWMVVDYKLFTARSPLKPNTLWVGEQAPGFWHAEDQTAVLAYGYWPSYNKALYPGTAARTGQDEMVAAHGNDYSYALTPRAEIFRRDQGLVTDEGGMRRILRYNQFQTDPLANRSACNQLACRGDLLHSPVADGAVNAKFTSSARLAAQELLFVAGPTADDQVPFQWSTAPPSVQAEPHAGQPDRWDFDWGTFGLL